MMDKDRAMYVRNFTFGVEDSLVSTVGLLSGVAAADVPQKTILLIGFVLILVEAFSMAVGSFISESSAEMYLKHATSPPRESRTAGLIMLFSYFIAGFIPLLPYVILPVKLAFGVSILASLTALFLLGVFGGKIAKVNGTRNGLRILIIGGAAVAIGVIAGKLIKI